MGEFFFIEYCDTKWIDFESMTKLIFFAESETPLGYEHGFPVGRQEDWPKMRTWVLQNCRGAVYMGYEHGRSRHWISLWFEYDEDAVGFRLAWLK